ncbi:MAG: helix-turn-helix transcriptional regulator [Planctomycetes bacterium]|nr:helix-turn-helix transcriptional regulator [Planctomycetota bacterium]
MGIDVVSPGEPAPSPPAVSLFPSPGLIAQKRPPEGVRPDKIDAAKDPRPPLEAKEITLGIQKEIGAHLLQFLDQYNTDIGSLKLAKGALQKFRYWYQAEVLLEVESHGYVYALIRRPTGQNDPLTEREKEIALLAASGLPNKAIAEALSISRWTVSTHLKKIYRKLQINSRTILAQKFQPIF